LRCSMLLALCPQPKAQRATQLQQWVH